MNSQRGISLPAGKTCEPSQISVPSLKDAAASEDASILYAALFETSKGKAAIEVQELPVNPHLQASDRMLLVHASASSSNQPVNRLANELLLVRDEEESAVPSSSIKGQAYLLYAQTGKEFTLHTDWEALHNVCYGAHLFKAGKQALDFESLAQEFVDKRDKLAAAGNDDSPMAVDKEVRVDDGNDDGDWTDEEVEKPREPRKDGESDDEEAGEDDNAEEEEEGDDEEEEDSEGSYEDESELESDDEDDPRKKALLEMIQQAIMKDGKLDLDRLGLVEKNGKLVPKDD
ncbi:hypothetical protein P389DRAFT_35134 [Cystobasidium minutum MCA 4210]|uniref:uncharacterized protein n=1 Tax=Cystobasidium minutum MCA 4210 TaxID=1397322 RepID=UPI0034CF783F|eukprot:jgi/Rhomi1/35134/CE35133_227